MRAPGAIPGAVLAVCHNGTMRSERGFHRVVNFSDAVVAIAITLLILPLVDAAGSIGSAGVGTFLNDNRTRLIAFALSFAVIGRFWWGQHQLLERAKGYNPALIAAMFVWLFTIVFLPLPTELIGSDSRAATAAHALYIGTMVVASLAILVQQWTLIRWPELRHDPEGEDLHIDAALVLSGLMAFALVVSITVPVVGLWSLLSLLLADPVERLLAMRRARLDH